MMTPQAGLFTLMGQVFHNNYTDGIRELGFHMEKERFYLDVREGEKNVALPEKQNMRASISTANPISARWKEDLPPMRMGERCWR